MDTTPREFGPDETHSVPPRRGEHLVLQAGTGRPGLGEPGGHDDGARHSGGAALLDRGENRRRRHRDDGEVGNSVEVARAGDRREARSTTAFNELTCAVERGLEMREDSSARRCPPPCR